MFLKDRQTDGHREWLVRLLLRRPHTEREASERLVRRGASEDEAQTLIAELREMQLLDDSVYARLFIEGHESWGFDRIASELARKGVPREDIRSALEDYEEEPSARELVERWRAAGVDMRQIIGRLRRRGFTSRTIRSVLKESEEVPW